MDKVKVWTKQHINILDTLKNEGRHVAKKEYLQKNENSNLVIGSYNWLMKFHPDIENCPKDADYPIWVALSKASNVPLSKDTVLLELEIDPSLLTYISVAKWGDMTNLFYLPADAEDEARHKKMLDRFGINDPDAYMSPFYPMIKKEIQQSWSRLFEEKVDKDKEYYYGLLWEIKAEWVTNVEFAKEEEGDEDVR